ncbi:MAG: phospholipase [Anaerolineaceae bacterium]|nr:phospholipase [Anaerolineaceae bacterium]
MRVTAYKNGIFAKAYAGTTGVLLAMDIDPAKRDGLLGFAIERYNAFNNSTGWLLGALNFPHASHTPGNLVSTNIAPIQKFRWSDYRVYPNSEYRYTIHPVYPPWGTPLLEPGPEIAVKTASLDDGEHRVIFNRAAAASQAFSHRFEDYIKQLNTALKAKQPVPPLPSKALAWLSRGLIEQILGFINRAKGTGWALDIAIYEYELPKIIHAVQEAHNRQVQVRVIYHGKSGDEQTLINRTNLAGLPENSKRERKTSSIFHDKFIVLSRIEKGEYQPQAVLCGSTNFTENGIYRQGNVVHIVENPEVSKQYLNLFENIFNGSTVGETRKYINRNNPFDTESDFFAGFSPRSSGHDLNGFVSLVDSAQCDVLFCTAFNLYDDLEESLLGKPQDNILRYGLQNTRSRITGIHADRTASFSATALYSRGLEGWIKESTYGQRGNILIHTKLIIVDLTSDHPTVISGSHNLSKSASNGNDENYLIIRNNTQVADIYGCELMRFYDHYRFRFHLAERIKKGTAQVPLTLSEDNSWTDRYFETDPLKILDRTRFAAH